MRSTLIETTSGTPLSSEDRGKVREQMNRLLDTSHFKNSRRYPALLRFIVEETLEGRGEHLKERLIGISVFQRAPDYDTAADPVVRVTIAEIRKRIAQYYNDEAHDSELRIELSPGHYAPEFRSSREGSSLPRTAFREEPPPTPFSLAVAQTEQPEAPTVPDLPASADRRRSKLVLLLPLVAALLLAAGAALLWRWRFPSEIDQLWGPVLAAHGPVLICLPAGAGRNKGPAAINAAGAGPAVLDQDGPVPVSRNSSFLDHESIGENIVFSDMLATVQVVDLLARHGHDYRMRLTVATTLDDLRHEPSVLIGGMDNQWTLRAIDNLRFKFLGNGHETYWISDRDHPKNQDWSLDLTAKYASITHDYAIIARIHNEQTGHVEMIAAGIGMSGTAAAGEFLADPKDITELRRRVGRGFADHDFEAVLETDVVNGIAGSPKILAVEVW